MHISHVMQMRILYCKPFLRIYADCSLLPGPLCHGFLWCQLDRDLAGWFVRFKGRWVYRYALCSVFSESRNIVVDGMLTKLSVAQLD